MTHPIRLPAVAVAAVAVFCLAFLTPTASSQLFAQQFQTPGNAQVYYYGTSPYYGNSPVDINRYGTAYGGAGYTGYGNGAYGYGTPAQYEYPASAVYGFRSSPTQHLYNRAFHLRSGTYRSLYNPTTTRYYSPYGYRRY
jgi:hypothetical protein